MLGLLVMKSLLMPRLLLPVGVANSEIAFGDSVEDPPPKKRRKAGTKAAATAAAAAGQDEGDAAAAAATATFAHLDPPADPPANLAQDEPDGGSEPAELTRTGAEAIVADAAATLPVKRGGVHLRALCAVCFLFQQCSAAF